MKKIMQTWGNFINESSFDPRRDRGVADTTFGKKLFDDFEGFAQSVAGSQHRDLSPASEYILANARLNIMRDLIPVASKLRTKIDEDFLVAWITGRLAPAGGPTIDDAKRSYGDHTNAKLFSKFKEASTKWDNISPTGPQGAPAEVTTDHPADGLSPISPEHSNVHQGGAHSGDNIGSSAPAAVTADRVLPILKAMMNMDFSTPESQKNLKNIIATLVNALESA